MSDELFIRDVMSRPITISKSAVITEALDKMLGEGVDPLIVIHNNTVVGTVLPRSWVPDVTRQSPQTLSMSQALLKKILRPFTRTRISKS